MAEYIEREALCEILDGWRDAHADVDDVHGCGLLEDVICEVDAQTAADVAPVVHGRIVGSLEDGRYRRRFSCCGEDATMITQWAWPKYCPNCGAKMDGGADHAAD